MVKQYVKNKKKAAYRSGELDVPEGYDHLKNNSACRNSSGLRGRKARIEYKAAKAAAEANRSEFLQGSSKDGEKGGSDKEEDDEEEESESGGDDDDDDDEEGEQ